MLQFAIENCQFIVDLPINFMVIFQLADCFAYQFHGYFPIRSIILPEGTVYIWVPYFRKPPYWALQDLTLSILIGFSIFSIIQRFGGTLF